MKFKLLLLKINTNIFTKFLIIIIIAFFNLHKKTLTEKIKLKEFKVKKFYFFYKKK